MRDIDEMDMLGFLAMRAWKVQRETRKRESVRRCIDEVWPQLRP